MGKKQALQICFYQEQHLKRGTVGRRGWWGNPHWHSGSNRSPKELFNLIGKAIARLKEPDLSVEYSESDKIRVEKGGSWIATVEYLPPSVTGRGFGQRFHSLHWYFGNTALFDEILRRAVPGIEIDWAPLGEIREPGSVGYAEH